MLWEGAAFEGVEVGEGGVKVIWEGGGGGEGGRWERDLGGGEGGVVCGGRGETG